jgi:hypothetical protein
VTEERFWLLVGMEAIRRAREEEAKPKPILLPVRADEEPWPPERRPAWADALMKGALH